MAQPVLNLGAWRQLNGSGGGPVLRLPAAHLVTHGVVVGMTGSGKTGLLTVLAEEALSAGVPALILDVKGDLPNLLLSLSTSDPKAYLPWVSATGNSSSDASIAAHDGAQKAEDDAANQLAAATEIVAARRAELAKSSLGEAELARFRQHVQIRVLTPGATSGEPLHVLSPLERRSPRWDTDPESARAALSAAVSLVLRLLGRDPDAAKSRDHVLLSVLAERRLLANEEASLPTLLNDVLTPPITEIGALPLAAFMKKREREQLAAALNTLLASPTFASWRQGASLDVAEWLAPHVDAASGTRRTSAVIVSVAHLDDEERALVLSLVLEEVLSWVRGLPGSQQLRALIIFDEVYGFLPPHPANPPTKRPIIALMKQARAFGVGVLVATQNPMDLDYRALSNAGLWFIGRLQTEADRTRVLDGLANADNAPKGDANGLDPADLARTVQRLSQRWFLVRNTHVAKGPVLLQPRTALSWLRGPMTRGELRRALEGRG